MKSARGGWPATQGRLILIGVSLILAGCALPRPSVQPYPSPTVLQGSIHIDDPGDVAREARLTADGAYRLAAGTSEALAGSPHSVQLALVTVDDYGPADQNGVLIQKLIDHRLAYVVRFAGTAPPCFGGIRSDGTPMCEGVTPNTETNILVDAKSGEVLMIFSFQ